MSERQTETAPTIETLTPAPKLEQGDHDKFAHYVVPPGAITEAMVTGTPVQAVCGKVWVPSRNPEGFPLCPACEEIKARVDEMWPDE